MVDFEERISAYDKEPKIYVVTYRKLGEDGQSLEELRKEYHRCPKAVDAFALASSPMRRIISLQKCFEDFDQPDERGESGLGRRGDEPTGLPPWEQEFIDALAGYGVSRDRAISVLITLNFAYEFFFGMRRFIGFDLVSGLDIGRITEKSLMPIGHCAWFLCGIRQFLVMALKLQNAPDALTYLGMNLPTRLSELTDPTHHESIPGWYRRFIRWDCKYIGKKAIRDFLFLNCPTAFDVMFQVLDRMVPGVELYEVRTAFINDLHEINHYLCTYLPFNPIRRIWATRRLKKSSQRFKYSCRDLSRELYLYETGVKVVKTSADIEPSSNSAIISEFVQILKAIKGDDGQMDKSCEVTRPEAAEICGVGYSTIKRWEEEGLPEWAADYPGRKNRKLLIQWAQTFKSSKRFRKAAKNLIHSAEIDKAKDSSSEE